MQLSGSCLAVIKEARIIIMQLSYSRHAVILWMPGSLQPVIKQLYGKGHLKLRMNL